MNAYHSTDFCLAPLDYCMLYVNLLTKSENYTNAALRKTEFRYVPEILRGLF